MISNFYEDLSKARKAEEIALAVLSSIYDDYWFEDVSNQREFFHRGDIKAVDKIKGTEYFFEIKDDCRIADTRNVLLEDEVLYHASNTCTPGNLHSDYEFYCVVSQSEKKIYVMDFSILQENYRSGIYKIIPHAEQTTFCYLLPLAKIKELGGLLKVIEY